MESLNILLAYSLDLAFGDPRWLPHPVKIIGNLINFLEDKLRAGRPQALRIKGAILALTIVACSGSISYLILTLARKIHPIAGGVVWIILAYTSLATKDLLVHARQILKAIDNKNIIEARCKLSHIVGRDTQGLTEDAIVKATIESVAESTNDGIIAPLFYLIVGGPAAALSYKAINTLDSMVGHRNEKYKDFGWFSARLDDAVNFIPARITGILISISAWLAGKGFIFPFKIMLRDGKKHPSPNSGISEAAMAGALKIRLGGASTYQDRLIEKPYLGEEARPISPFLINEALGISLITSLLMVLIGAAAKCFL